MQVFIRTLIITLVLCGGYYIWVFLAKASYNPDLTISKEAQNVVTQVTHEKNIDENQIIPDTETKTTVDLAFLNNEDTIKIVKRNSKHETLYSAVALLLKGPTKEEQEKGIFTEIPKGTKLISVKNDGNKIIINLSDEFGEGGGTQSVEARITQLSRTSKKYSDGKPIYLYLNGTEAQYLGGEGIFVEQPLK